MQNKGVPPKCGRGVSPRTYSDLLCSDHMRLCKSGEMMSNRSVLDSNTEDVILNRVDASNTEDFVARLGIVSLLSIVSYVQTYVSN